MNDHRSYIRNLCNCKESLKKFQAWTGFEPMTSAIPVQCSTIYYVFCLISTHHLSGYITNSHNEQLPVGLIAQLVDHCTGIGEVMGSNPVQAWIFFRPSFRNCLSCVYNFDDHPLIHFLLSVAAWINLNAFSFNSFNSPGQKSHERRKRSHGEYWTTETWRHQGTNGWSAGKEGR